MNDVIRIRGARENNLKDVSKELREEEEKVEI